ncbi:MAG: hypothetical protein JO146_07550 [Candidatus Eremiobacteraeota bacterium]|nr:hypothetical protein [Candidatus Eremiobacteraeota bacterium]
MSRLPVAALCLTAVALSACVMNGANPAGNARGLQGQVPQASARVARSNGKISHVIVVIQENRSFENFFAGYPGANAPTTGCASPAPSPSPRMPATAGTDPHPATTGSPCPPGDVQVPLHSVTFKNNPDLRHDWRSSMTDWNNGQMDGFTAWGVKNGQYKAYAYLKQSEIQPYWTMAQQYVLADAMFPTEFGGSFTAHLTLVAGTDDIKLPGQAEVNFPTHAPDDCDSPQGTVSSYVSQNPYRKLHLFQGPFPCFDQFNTMAEVLDKNKVSWKYYATRRLDGGFWEPFEAIKYVRYGPDWKTNIIAPQTKFLTDAKHGKLAAVSWVTPSGPDSDHPTYLSDLGPSWVSSVVNAVGEGPDWNTSAIIVLWDDWGGFYDNAAPPQLDYRGLGIRVPCLIISPYAKQGYVTHVQYEYGSILRFIEDVNGIPAGAIGHTVNGYTDKRANSLGDAFDFSQPPRKFVPIQSKYPMSRFINEPPSNDPVDTE